MCNMSRKSKSEYIAEKRRAYVNAGKAKRSRILDEVCEKFNRIITVEDGILNGGFGSAVLEYINDHNRDVKVERMGIPDKFVEHGSVKELRKLIHLDADAICKQIEQ